MQLVTMHKILIRTGIGGAFLFCAWSVYSWSGTGGAGALVLALVSGAVAVGMTAYLRAFTRKQKARGGRSRSAAPRPG